MLIISVYHHRIQCKVVRNRHGEKVYDYTTNIIGIKRVHIVLVCRRAD